jgi:hypothetical protein
VSVLLGNGDGTFLPAQTYGAGGGPVAVGDFNGDGKLDLAVANGYSNTVSVLLGKGDGTFLPAVNYPAGNAPDSVAVGDFNGDGILDIAVANLGTYPSYSDGSVSMLLGKGDGTFLPAVSFAAGIRAIYVAVGDFNGDGIPDLAVANVGTYPSYSDGSVSILLGKGDGTLLPPVNYPTGTYSDSVAVGDFNGDGKQDLAVANYSSNLLYGGVSVLLGKGDGTFLPAQTFPAGTYSDSVAVGDFNGDGKQDLAVVNTYPLNTVSVLLGKGDGTFQAALKYAAGIFPESVAVGDFNGDGFPDLVTANLGTWPSYSDSSVSVLLGKGDGTFLPAQSYAAGAGRRSVAVGDFNGDGKLDLAVAGYGLYVDYYGNVHIIDETVRVLLGNGDGTFQPAQSFPAGKSPRSVAVGDFNGDGKQDLAVADNGVYIICSG